MAGTAWSGPERTGEERWGEDWQVNSGVRIVLPRTS